MTPAPSPDSMAPAGPVLTSPPTAPVLAAAAPAAAPQGVSGTVVALVAAVAVAALVLSSMLWQRLGHSQEQLARQAAEAQAQAIEARTVAREAQEVARETATRQTLSDTRLSEVALQRTQLEELMQSLSRSRDENLVVDIDAGLRLAQQQAQLTGSLQPLVAALKSASQRIERAAQPRLAPVQRAIGHDLERLEQASVTDTAGLLVRIDDLVHQVDELPLSTRWPRPP